MAYREHLLISVIISLQCLHFTEQNLLSAVLKLPLDTSVLAFQVVFWPSQSFENFTILLL